MPKYISFISLLFIYLSATTSALAMDGEISLRDEIQAMAKKDIKSISISLGNGLTYLLEAEKARRAYPGYHFHDPAARLIPLHVNSDDGKRLFTNVLLPYALLFAHQCKINTFLKYNHRTYEFDMAQIDSPLVFDFSKKFLQEVAHKIEQEHEITLIDKAFLTAQYEKKIKELSSQINELTKSREFFMVGCIFLSIFIFFRCDWISVREIF